MSDISEFSEISRNSDKMVDSEGFAIRSRNNTYRDEHYVSLRQLQDKLSTNYENGLTTKEANERLTEDGPNVLTPPKKTPEWLKFCTIMFTGFAALLWIAGLLCFLAYGIETFSVNSNPSDDNLYLGCTLIVVVFVSGMFSYYQERKSGQIMESFHKMVPVKANVIRDGKSVEIYVDDIVVGDIVLMKGGDKVPADVRILESSSLKVDNSSLTGESVAVQLKPDTSDIQVLESRNLAFFSTNVMEGRGKGVVVRTGDDTIIGTIAGLASGIKSVQTPLNKEISLFINVITVIAVFLGVMFGIIAFCMGYTWIKSVVFLIGIIVANVPEGILITVTVSLSLTAKRMARKNCLVKNLEGVETLGSTSVICTDKTGTLTQNKMTVAHVWLNQRVISIQTAETSYGANFDKEQPGWKELATIAGLCLTADFLEEDLEKPVIERRVDGDASETGILKCYESIEGNSATFRSKNPKVIEIPFNSSNKYQVSVHNMGGSGKFLLVMKGAPETVFSKCSTFLDEGETVNIDETITQKFKEASSKLASMGERVLGFCDLALDPASFPPDFQFSTEDEPNFPLHELRFVGFMSMIDPPKASVPEAVRKCRSAGIQVIMVTGDHPETGAAIGRQVGIIGEKSEVLVYNKNTIPPENSESVSAVIHGNLLESHIDDPKLEEIIRKHKEIVFARSSPQHKLRIVKAFQAKGSVVAVTGDGVNDSPAMKQADIGVSMGISGSEVSKEAADMVLLDDNFATIVTGVEEGRLIFDNLKKSIVYTLTSNIPEIIPFLTWVVLNIPLPLSTIHILLIDLGTDMVPAISLAYEHAESDIMKRKPRDPLQDRLVNRRLIFLAYGCVGFLQAAAGFFNYFVIMAEHGWLPHSLIGIRAQWDDESIGNLVDSYGEEWSYEARMTLQETCNTAFFLSIVQVQWTDLIISKTRYVSIVTQGMSNWVLNFAILFETILAVLLIYVPVVPEYIGLHPLEGNWWLPALPFSLLILLVDEMRRYCIRRGNDDWLGRVVFQETYY